MAQATDSREVVLVAFGSLSDPAPHQAALERMAGEVAEALPGWTIRGATLGADGAIPQAFDGLGPDAAVFPLLMSDGWLLRRVLADALKAAGRADAQVLTPLGLLPAFQEICAGMILNALAENRMAARDTTVVLAAHGSARGPRPAACARMFCAELERLTGVREVVPGYLEEAPFLADALRTTRSPTICLPCFVVNAWHATMDVPDAVAKSGFDGPVLPAAGTVPGVAEVIADEIVQSIGRTRAA